jgi:putative hydrolase of the HAD superfamily
VKKNKTAQTEPKPQPIIKNIIFDLDGTLYASPEVFRKFAEAAYYTYAKVTRTPIEEAKKILEERRSELARQKGFSVPYTLALISFDIPIQTWHEENVAFFDPADYLSVNQALRDHLLALKRSYRLTVLTNNNQIQTRRIVQALGLDAVFNDVFTFNTFNLLKPDPGILGGVLKRLEARPDECLMVGDRFEVDLIPAREMGMRIYEVKGPEDILKLSRELIQNISINDH